MQLCGFWCLLKLRTSIVLDFIRSCQRQPTSALPQCPQCAAWRHCEQQLRHRCVPPSQHAAARERARSGLPAGQPQGCGQSKSSGARGRDRRCQLVARPGRATYDGTGLVLHRRRLTPSHERNGTTSSARSRASIHRSAGDGRAPWTARASSTRAPVAATWRCLWRTFWGRMCCSATCRQGHSKWLQNARKGPRSRSRRRPWTARNWDHFE